MFLRLSVILLSTAILHQADCYKFLLYMPQHGRSHVHFLSTLANTLIDAGHNVTVLLNKWDTTVNVGAISRATVIEVPQQPAMKEVQEQMYKEDDTQFGVWKNNSGLKVIMMMFQVMRSWLGQCEAAITQPGLLEHLREEKFDVAFAETFDACGFGIFHRVGIEKSAVAWSYATFEVGFDLTGAPYVPSYVPGASATYTDEMSFGNRLHSFITIGIVKTALIFMMRPYDQLFSSKFGEDFPPAWETYTKASLVFLNYDPLVEFPRPTTHKIVDIGGITVEGVQTKLNQTWDEIMTRRPKIVLMAFGTMALSYQMLPEYKETIRETFRKFPDVTFIWKYEKPEDNIGKGIGNIVPVTWVPQREMLRDPRLSLFITHSGQGSNTEAMEAGVPLIAIPISGDQYRNSQVVKRNGVGVVLEKQDLGRSDVLEAAIREVLENDIYRQRAKRISSMLAARPFSPKETFVRQMEFLARFGPLRNLDHYGTKLSFMQYYSLDVIAVVSSIVIGILILTLLFLRFILRRIRSLYTRSSSGKTKAE